MRVRWDWAWVWHTRRPLQPKKFLRSSTSRPTWKRPVFVHMRHGGTSVPGIFESLQEVIADASIAGASLHVVHLNSMAQKKTPEALRMIEGARARGLDVTTEAYPYIAGHSRIESALFDLGWQGKQG